MKSFQDLGLSQTLAEPLTAEGLIAPDSNTHLTLPTTPYE